MKRNPESSGREPLSHPRRRSVAHARARGDQREAARDARARRRSSRAHAGAHLDAHRRLQRRGQDQRRRRGARREVRARRPARPASIRRCTTATTCSSNRRRRCMAGNFAAARAAGRKTAALVAPMAGEMAMLQPFALQEVLALVRFERWDEVLAAASAAGRSRPADRRSITSRAGAALAGKRPGRRRRQGAGGARGVRCARAQGRDVQHRQSGRRFCSTSRALDLAARIADARGNARAADRGVEARRRGGRQGRLRRAARLAAADARRAWRGADACRERRGSREGLSRRPRAEPQESRGRCSACGRRSSGRERRPRRPRSNRVRRGVDRRRYDAVGCGVGGEAIGLVGHRIACRSKFKQEKRGTSIRPRWFSSG